MLRKSFKLVLHKRKSWHIQRLFWFHWRDPANGARLRIAASAPPPGCFATTTGRSPHIGRSGASPEAVHLSAGASMSGLNPARVLLDTSRLCAADASGKGCIGAVPRMTRTAIVLAGLVLAAARPVHGGGRPGRSSSASSRPPRSTTRTSRGWPTARVRTNRFVLKWGWVQPNQGSFRWGPADRFIGRLAIHGIRTVPAVWGNPDWLAGSGSTPPIGGADGRERVAELPQGAGGALRAGRQLLGHRLPASDTGLTPMPLPIQSWQIWNEPNLKKYFAPSRLARKVRAAGADLRRRDPKRASAGPGRACRHVRQRGHHRLGLPQRRLRGARDQDQVRRRRPAPVRADPRPTAASRSRRFAR